MLALLRYALEVALEHDKPSAALRGYFNLADSLSQADRYEEAESAVRDGLAYARRVGNRYQELLFLGQSYALFALGKWDEALDWAAELPEDWMSARQAYSTVSSICVSVLVHQGNLEEARAGGGASRRFRHVRGRAGARRSRLRPCSAAPSAR